VGAFHPFHLSNTALLYLNGSHGINIEPNTDLIRAFTKHRKRDITLNIALSDRDEIKTLYRMPISALNTLSLEDARKNEKIYNIRIEGTQEIRCREMAYVIDNHFGSVMPDFMSIDVEGYEYEIFQSFDLNKLRPKVICVEAYDIHENGKEIRQKLLDYLNEFDYTIYADTGLNVILNSTRL
jgi:FkbM family methyltransferase